MTGQGKKEGSKAFVLSNVWKKQSFHSFEKADTWDDDQQAVKITYGWKKNSDLMNQLHLYFFTGFQNGVEVDGIVLSDDIDLGIGQKDVQRAMGRKVVKLG